LAAPMRREAPPASTAAGIGTFIARMLASEKAVP
jgi:hypothetical protein